MIKKLVLGVFLALVIFTCKAQKVTTETIKHNYFRTPKYILSKEKKINKEVIISYKEDNELISDINKNVNLQRKENAESEKKSYEEKKTSSKIAERILLGKKKPKNATYANKPYTQKEWSADHIINNGCKTMSLGHSTNTKAKIKITVLPINITKETINAEAATQKDGSIRAAYYTYHINGQAGLKVEAFNELGKLVISENFSSWQNTRSKKYSSRSARNKDFTQNDKAIKLGFEKKLMATDLNHLQTYINDNFENQITEKKSKIFSIKDKKGVYTQINECSLTFAKGIQYLSTEDSYSKGTGIIKELIPVYESQLKEYDPTNKKARINKNIAQALYLNLAQAYIWTNDYEKANNCIIEYNIINPKKNKKYIIELKAFLDDQEIRFKANS